MTKRNGSFPTFFALLLVLALISSCGGGNKSTSAPFENKLSSDTKVMDQDPTVVLSAVTGSIYTYTYSGSTPTINPGTVLLGSEGEGYLRKVISVNDLGGSVEVLTEEAALVDAFENLSINTSFGMDSDISYISKASQQRVSQAVSVGQGGKLKINLNDSVSIGGGAGYSITPRGDYSIQPKMTVEILIKDHKIEKFRVEIEGEATLAASLAVSFEGAVNANFERPIIQDVPFAELPIPVIIGGVPVATINLTAKMGIYWGVEASVGGKAIGLIGFNSTYNAIAGAQYKNGTWYPIQSFSYKFTPHMTVDNAVVASIKPYLRVQPGLYILGGVGPFISITPYAKGTISISPSQITGGFGVSAGLGGKVKISIADYTLTDLSASCQILDLYYTNPSWVFPIGADLTRFVGHWIGPWNSTAIGQSGTLDIIVSSNGIATGTVTNTNLGLTGTLSGTIDSNGNVIGSYLYPPPNGIVNTTGTVSINPSGNLIGTVQPGTILVNLVKQ